MFPGNARKLAGTGKLKLEKADGEGYEHWKITRNKQLDGKNQKDEKFIGNFSRLHFNFSGLGL